MNSIVGTYHSKPRSEIPRESFIRSNLLQVRVEGILEPSVYKVLLSVALETLIEGSLEVLQGQSIVENIG